MHTNNAVTVKPVDGELVFFDFDGSELYTCGVVDGALYVYTLHRNGVITVSNYANLITILGFITSEYTHASYTC